MGLKNLRDKNNFNVFERSIILFIIIFHDFFQAPQGVSIYGNVYAYVECYYDEFYKYTCPVSLNQYNYISFSNVTDASGSISVQFDTRRFTTISISVFSPLPVLFRTLEFRFFQMSSPNANGIYKYLRSSGNSGVKTEILTKR